MSRQIICYEGKHPVNGKTIAPGALTWVADKPIPITLSASAGSDLAGRASYLRREEDGAITAWMDFSVDGLDSVMDGLGWTIYATHISSEKKGSLITAGLIRQIFLSEGLPWAEQSHGKQGL